MNRYSEPWLTVRQSQVRRRWAQMQEPGKTVNHQLDDLIDEWHEAVEDGTPLHTHLGMSWEQYARWASGYGLPANWKPPTKEKNVTITAAAPPQETEDVYADLSAMRLEYQHFQKLLDERRLIDEAIAAYQKKFTDAIQATPDAVGFSIDGVRRFAYKQNGTFPHAKFAAANPGIAAAYMTTVEVFDTAAFARHNPELYKQWRPRRFVAITAATKG